MRRLLLLVMLCLAITSSSWAAAVVPVWQSNRSHGGRDADARLEGTVSISVAGGELGPVLDALGKASGVSLACAEDFQARPLTIYLPGTRLKEVMAELAAFTMGEWWAEGDPPRYTLRKTQQLRAAEESLVSRALEMSANLPPPSPEKVAAITQRLREYAEGLSVPQDQLVARYGETDPWLAVDLVDPASRGIVPFLVGLNQEQVTALATERRGLLLRMRDLPTGAQQHLERWLREEAKPSADPEAPVIDLLAPDDVAGYNSWEERWAHATVRLHWNDDSVGGISIFPQVPGVPFYQALRPVSAKDGHRGQALARLFRLTTPNPSEEQSEAFRRKVEPIWEAETRRAEQRRQEEQQAGLRTRYREAPADWSDRAVLERRLVPWPKGRDRADANELLTHAAACVQTPLLADAVEDGRVFEPRPEFEREQTLREAIVLLSTASRLGWSKPLGRFAWMTTAPWWRTRMAAVLLTPEVRARIEQAVQGKQQVTLEEYAALVSGLGLTPPQEWAACEVVFGPGMGQFPRVTLYLRGPAGRRLLAGEEAPLSECDPTARQRVTLDLTFERPWVREEQLTDATLALTRVRVDGGSEMVRIILNPHLAEEPKDRMLLEQVPAVMPVIRPNKTADESTRPAVEVKATAGGPATLAQTNWRYRGYVAFGTGPAAMLVNESTGEMEMAEVGASFRGLAVAAAGDAEVRFTDSAGETVTLSLERRGPAEPGL